MNSTTRNHFRRTVTNMRELPGAVRRRLDRVAALEAENARLREAAQRLEGDKSGLINEIKNLNETIGMLRDTAGVAESEAEGEVHYPGIIFNTLPKSGSIYIAHTLANSLRIPLMTHSIAHGFFPHYFMQPNPLRYLCKGDRIRQEHFDASSINLQILRRHTDRLVLHVRDPRQATLSWTHHIGHMLEADPNSQQYSIHLPEIEYLSWPLERKIYWNLETHLVAVADWLKGWMNAIENDGGLRILVTTYEELIADEDALLRRICAFYDIPDSAIEKKAVEKSIAYNYRQGTADEWRSVFNDEQKEKSVRIIGRDLLRYFGWSAE